MTMGTLLLLGARSDIGLATAHRFAKAGYDIQLAARNSAALEPARADLQLRYNVSVSLHDFDVLDRQSYDRFLDALPELPDLVVCAIGLMGDQIENEKDIEAASLVVRSTYEGPALILEALANRFDRRGSGKIVGISSVAGNRGRAKNYVYGSAKAGFNAYLSGLRNRMARRGIHVMTVLPGFVNTKMTHGMDLPEKLTAEPEEVADAIYEGLRRGRNVIYVRAIWRIVMTIINAIPEPIFKKMNI
ncbi:short-chain dehydrogenase [Roseovarius atlanticus]|uniref:Short-chain dehydrogenase n=1 Tax=Roseovarius atlanticus TaxID=1641875 RepID=A0A0T5NU72_9RHOB|nr:SDR family oxidoreductase [Roseovarius atlanticus]KRS12469.1 short-chain dehydrogenase [Roseovarius atlanticus]